MRLTDQRLPYRAKADRLLRKSSMSATRVALSLGSTGKGQHVGQRPRLPLDVAELLRPLLGTIRINVCPYTNLQEWLAESGHLNLIYPFETDGVFSNQEGFNFPLLNFVRTQVNTPQIVINIALCSPSLHSLGIPVAPL